MAFILFLCARNCLISRSSHLCHGNWMCQVNSKIPLVQVCCPCTSVTLWVQIWQWLAVWWISFVCLRGRSGSFWWCTINLMPNSGMFILIFYFSSRQSSGSPVRCAVAWLNMHWGEVQQSIGCSLGTVWSGGQNLCCLLPLRICGQTSPFPHSFMPWKWWLMFMKAGLQLHDAIGICCTALMLDADAPYSMRWKPPEDLVP